MIRTLIVEDDPAEAQRLTEFIRRYGSARDEAFQITWLKSAMEMLSDQAHYDLVLLDIDLPGLSGMEAAQLMRVYDETTPIIFVTNLAKYAVKGYEVGASGFIVKPVSWGNLSLNLDRALRAIHQNVGRSVMVPTEDGVRVISFNQLVYVEVMGHRLSYHLEDGSVLEARGALAQLEGELGDSPVIRISKSCIVNMDKIVLVRPQSLQVVTGETLPVSRMRKHEVTESVTSYLGSRR